MARTAMWLVALGGILTSCGLAEDLFDCPGMPEGGTCCDGVHYCEAGSTCNNANGTCVSGGGGGGATCSQQGAVDYFTENCHRTSGGIQFVGAPWPKACGSCPSGITTTDGQDTVTSGGPYWLCVCN